MLSTSRLVLAAAAVLAALTLSPSSTTLAQTAQDSSKDASQVSWQEFRSDELGFRVEMPGKPKVEEENDEETVGDKKQNVKSTNVQLDHGDTSLGVSCAQFGKGFRQRPIDAYVDDIIKRIEKGLGVKVTRQNRLTINDQPVREFFAEANGFYVAARVAILDDRIIQAVALGDTPLAGNPVAERFLQSFELLPEKK